MVAFMISKHSNSPFEPQQASPGCSTNTQALSAVQSAQPHPGWATWGGAFQSQVEKPLGLQTWHWLGAILLGFFHGHGLGALHTACAQHAICRSFTSRAHQGCSMPPVGIGNLIVAHFCLPPWLGQAVRGPILLCRFPHGLLSQALSSGRVHIYKYIYIYM